MAAIIALPRSLVFLMEGRKANGNGLSPLCSWISHDTLAALRPYLDSIIAILLFLPVLHDLWKIKSNSFPKGKIEGLAHAVKSKLLHLLYPSTARLTTSCPSGLSQVPPPQRAFPDHPIEEAQTMIGIPCCISSVAFTSMYTSFVHLNLYCLVACLPLLPQLEWEWGFICLIHCYIPQGLAQSLASWSSSFILIDYLGSVLLLAWSLTGCEALGKTFHLYNGDWLYPQGEFGMPNALLPIIINFLHLCDRNLSPGPLSPRPGLSSHRGGSWGPKR